MTWASPTRAPSIWRSPASPRRWWQISHTLAMPVAAMGWPFDWRPPETFTVDYTLGAKRYQGYLSRLSDGRIYVLPAFWYVEGRRWIDWKQITPVPDGAHDLRQIWNANCFNCHATNLAQGFDVEAKTYRTTWTEMGIGCEACHGPGREHVAIAEGWEKNPATKPADLAVLQAHVRACTGR